jgi:hypothetical protein
VAVSVPLSAGLTLTFAKTIATGHGGTIRGDEPRGSRDALHGLAAVRAMTSLDAG